MQEYPDEQCRALWALVIQSIKRKKTERRLDFREPEKRIQGIACPVARTGNDLVCLSREEKAFLARKSQNHLANRPSLKGKKSDKITRIDLHGLNQQKAYSLLLAFLPQAYEGGTRDILIITGKGSGEKTGVFQRLVPLWLQTDVFRPYVSADTHTHDKKAGKGAFYVRLKRKI